MALVKKLVLTDNFGGQTAYDCYVRIVEVRSSKTNAVAKYNIMSADQVKVYESKDIDFETSVALDSPNIWTQAYRALKALPMFENAMDC